MSKTFARILGALLPITVLLVPSIAHADLRLDAQAQSAHPRTHPCDPRLHEAPARSSAGQQQDRLPSGFRITEFPLPQPDSTPLVITLGRDCALWFTEVFATPSRIGRMTTDG